MPTTLPGVSAGHAVTALPAGSRAARNSRRWPPSFGKVGRADTATDPAPFSMAETTIRLKPRAEWPKRGADALVLGLGAPGLRRGARAGLARRRHRRRPRSSSTSSIRRRAPRLGQRLDCAGARAHGHDVDGGANAGRDSHRRRGCRRAWMRWGRRCRSEVARVPRDTKRGVRIAGWRALAEAGARLPRLARITSTRRSRNRPPISC